MIQWTEKNIALLGTMTDLCVAKKLNIHRCTVTAKRLQLRIPAKTKKTPLVWTPEKIALLGTMTDLALAKKLGAKITVVHKMRRDLGIPAAHPLPEHDWDSLKDRLGKSPDREIAAELKTSVSAVSQMRRKMKIPAFRPVCYRRWEESEIVIVGEDLDVITAIELGRSLKSVRAKRRSINIEAIPKKAFVESVKKAL